MTIFKAKQSSPVTYAFTANILYFALCIIFNTVDTQDQTTNIIFLTLSVLFWFVMGRAFTKNSREKNPVKSLAFIALSFAPIIIYLIIYNILSFLPINGTTNNWVLFYSIGAPVLFFIKPAVFLLNIINVQFYLFAYLYAAALMLFSFLGLISYRKNIKSHSSKSHTVKDEHITSGGKKESAANQAALSLDDITPEQKLKSYEILYEEIIAADADDGYVQVTFDNFNDKENKPVNNNLSDKIDKSNKLPQTKDDKKDTEG